MAKLTFTKLGLKPNKDIKTFIYNNQDIRKLEPFCIFLNENGEIRRIDDLLKNEKLNKIDQRIIEGFLKSKSFQKTLLYDDISNCFSYKSTILS